MTPSTRITRTAPLASLALSLMACGGGGSSDDSPPPPNRAPQVALANAAQQAIQFHAFDYDFTQGGRTFVDPDGDRLTYLVRFDPIANGLRVSGTRIVGNPELPAVLTVTVTANDPSNVAASDTFTISIAANGVPQPMNVRQDLLLQVDESFVLDATLGGTRLTDPDGDPLTYQLSTRGFPGITINGTQLSGRLSTVGAVEVTVRASDPYGASAQAVFMIAAPAAPPGAPTLPSPAFIYRDESLPLPDDFRTSSELRVPLWDMQPPHNRTTDAGATLGRVLFHDPRLSITNTISCSSCHRLDHGLASPERFNTGVLGIPLVRNSMALANARYNIHAVWFSDLRAASLQDVARLALTTPDEMAASLPAIETKLRATSFYPPLFEAAFGDSAIDTDRILRALAQYVQALISYRTKYDAACDTVNRVFKDCSLGLTAQEERGRQIFSGNNAGQLTCTQCHSLPAGANVWLANNGLDAVFTDPGISDGRFRPASLHNIARTAPYMHDGRFATLREVIEHYDHDIKASAQLDPLLREATGIPKRMNLSEEDKDALEAFLHTLTDEEMLADPRFADPFD